MAEILYMPQLSPTMKEGRIEKWLKKEGDRIEEGEIIAEVETDKAVMDMEAFAGGILLKILVQEGEKVGVGEPVAVVGEKGENIENIDILKRKEEEEVPISSEKKVREEEVKEEREEVPKVSRVRISPVARLLAKKWGISLEEVQGTGPMGRIIKRDILRALEEKKKKRERKEREEWISLSSLQEAMAKSMWEAKREVPHFYLFREVDVEELLFYKKKIGDAIEKGVFPDKVRITITDFIIRASALALKRHPEVNVEFSFKKGILPKKDISVGIAVAIEGGLVVAVLREVDKKSLWEIAKEREELVERARKRKLLPEEMQGESFTISNLGMFGISYFSAIIHPPAVAVLSVGTVEVKPVYDEEKGVFLPRKRMTLGLSCDHRALDGVMGARFLETLALLIENPYVL